MRYAGLGSLQWAESVVTRIVTVDVTGGNQPKINITATATKPLFISLVVPPSAVPYSSPISLLFICAMDTQSPSSRPQAFTCDKCSRSFSKVGGLRNHQWACERKLWEAAMTEQYMERQERRQRGRDHGASTLVYLNNLVMTILSWSDKAVAAQGQRPRKCPAWEDPELLGEPSQSHKMTSKSVIPPLSHASASSSISNKAPASAPSKEIMEQIKESSTIAGQGMPLYFYDSCCLCHFYTQYADLYALIVTLCPKTDSICTEYHPTSRLGATVEAFGDYRKHTSKLPSIPEILDPWHPFKSCVDFQLAQLAVEACLSSKQMDMLCQAIKECIQSPNSFHLSSHHNIHCLWDTASSMLTPVPNTVLLHHVHYI